MRIFDGKRPGAEEEGEVLLFVSVVF